MRCCLSKTNVSFLNTWQPACVQIIRRCSNGNGSGAPANRKRNPMEVLSNIFQTNPSALRIHRELTISIAKGDVEAAQDLAAVLAGMVKKIQTETAEETPDGTSAVKAAKDSRQVEETPLPKVSPTDVDAAVEKTREELEKLTNVEDFLGEGKGVKAGKNVSQELTTEKFWEDPSKLCITILEAAFETILSEDADDNPLSERGSKTLKEEERSLAILDEYLIKEKESWQKQKDAIAFAVLSVAKKLGITPKDLQATESSGSSREHLAPLKHCNIVIRGEVPQVVDALGGGKSRDGEDSVRAGVQEQLRLLKDRMRELGTPLNEKDEQMALYELLLVTSKMRYVVGLHRDLQFAVDTSDGIKSHIGEKNIPGSAYFVDQVIKKLNATPEELEGQTQSLRDVETAHAISTPKLPFTFMLKCCLWFEVPK